MGTGSSKPSLIRSQFIVTYSFFRKPQQHMCTLDKHNFVYNFKNVYGFARKPVQGPSGNQLMIDPSGPWCM